ncbi:MAG: hypothetical protein HYS19_04325 [Nitrosomonadales bacterium]|nr:hypothetical protein [Nitrosomonadales bacterium]
MISIKKVTPFAVLAALFISSAALADEAYVCKQGNQERVINIVYANAGAAVPCEVTYTKEDGTTQSLWQAQNVAGYCEDNAAAFVEKQRGWGWDCSKQ